MNFFDNYNYLQLINIKKLNQKIHFLLVENQDFEIKKKIIYIFYKFKIRHMKIYLN